LEYTVDDWTIAKMAESLGHADDAKLFYQRSANYRNLFDRSTGFFRGRKANGEWRTPFTPNTLVNDEYTEADAWQYLFSVQHDVPGMIALQGGGQNFIEKMDSMFLADSNFYPYLPDITGMIGQYSQGDEQSHHVAYLYDYAGAPYKTQQRVRQAMASFFNDTPAGHCGNVDCGQMAAWYVFSALGFYPVNPVSGIYAIGSPVVSKAVIHLDSKYFPGHKFTVIAKNNNADNIYIQSATLNGQPLNRPWITRTEVTAGGTLKLKMGSKPNPDWGSAKTVRPPATMPSNFVYPPLAPATNK
jgi:predicted alpha-1,2-mannosidase